MAKAGISFREIGSDSAGANYGRMSYSDFEIINSRQEWANWFLISKCLHKTIPNQPLHALDVGCGTGTSTKVLAYYLPPGSTIIANDLTANLLESARNKSYNCLYNGEPVQVSFVAQDACKPFVDADGKPLIADSIDYFNASGIVGHHLTSGAFSQLAKNAALVVKSGGYAAIDEGPALGESEIIPIMKRYGFVLQRKVRILPRFKRGQLLFRMGRQLD